MEILSQLTIVQYDLAVQFKQIRQVRSPYYSKATALFSELYTCSFHSFKFRASTEFSKVLSTVRYKCFVHVLTM